MTRQARREIEQAFVQSAGPGTFNPMIDSMTTAALANGMDRPTVISLLLNEVAAVAGAGRREEGSMLGSPSKDALIYASINSQAQATKRSVDALRAGR